MITDFTYTEAKELLNEIGRFKIEKYNHYGLTIISAGEEEYAIGTENEADEAWEEALESYWDDCVESQVPDFIKRYLDYDKWEYDAKIDGRGHSLSLYDGDEIDVVDLVMFRLN